MPSGIRRPLLALTLACAALVPGTSSAQSPWLDRGHDHTILLEGQKPIYPFDGESFFTTTWFLDARVGLAPRVHLVCELPWAHFARRSLSESQLGNPYLGFEYGSGGRGASGELGFHLPAVSGDAESAPVLSGIFSDVDRWEAFWPDLIGVSGAVDYRYVAPSGVTLRGRLGPSLWIPSQGAGDAELFAIYGGWVGFDGRLARIEAGWSGRVFLTGEGVFSEENLNHQLAASADFGSGRVRPGLHARLPLGDLSNTVDAVVGVRLGVRL
jgi:hypothetical protein